MRLRVIALLALTVILTGCGANGRPGAAVIIDDQVVTMNQVDTTAEVICQLALAQGQAASFPGGQVRGRAATELALSVIAERVVKREQLNIRDSDVDISDAERETIADRLPELDLDDAVQVLQTGSRTAATAEALGAKLDRTEPTERNAAALERSGREALMDELVRTEPEFSARLDLGESARFAKQPPKLSVQVSEPQQVPATQTCR